MANKILQRIFYGPSDADAAPLGGTRAQSVQRLQVGVAGVVAMILLVALADLIQDRAAQTESIAVPEAASTVAAKETGTPQSDPLVEAGVVPDLPAEPTASPEPGSAPAAPQAQGNSAQ
ncbi:hypothetical protein [Pontixanthobacter sp.]|uniref:hypothetical protein n=1 Tax=Pontixanthobacter sp. TaxID=2792078 RepID=UPI003C79D443